MTKITVIKEDITQLDVDAIVNAANTTLLGGGGVDGAIHKAAGPELLIECGELHGCNTGEAKITKGYKLHAKYIIHAVGPVWEGGNNNEEQLLHNAYYNSLLVAKTNAVQTIAFPNISTGAHHYPKQQAAITALTAISTFCKENPDALKEIFLTCADEENFNIYHTFLKG